MARFKLHVPPALYSNMLVHAAVVADPREILRFQCGIVRDWQLDDSVEIVIEWLWRFDHKAELRDDVPGVGTGRIL